MLDILRWVLAMLLIGTMGLILVFPPIMLIRDSLRTVSWPSRWECLHPRKAWWMAHVGRKLAKAYEADQEAARRSRVPRCVPYAVRIHVPSIERPSMQVWDGTGGKVVGERYAYGGLEHFYQILLANGQVIECLAQYCVRVERLE